MCVIVDLPSPLIPAHCGRVPPAAIPKVARHRIPVANPDMNHPMNRDLSLQFGNRFPIICPVIRNLLPIYHRVANEERWISCQSD